MPVAFILESIMQTCVFVITSLPEMTSTLLLFNGCKVRTDSQPVRPGDRMETYAGLENCRNGIFSGSGCASVNGTPFCEMEFTLVSPDCMRKVQNVRKV